MPEEAEIVNNRSKEPGISSFVSEFLSNFISWKKLTDDLILEVLNFLLSKTSAAKAPLSAFLAYQANFQNLENDSNIFLLLVIKLLLLLKFSCGGNLLPEICYFLVLIFLVEQRRYEEDKTCSMDGLNPLMDINAVEPVTIGAIASRLYFYYSYTHKVSGDLAEIRCALFGLHKVAILNHDELGQLSLLVDRLLKKRKEKKLCRYLFYLGKIRTIRLEYSDAKERCVQAAQIAPVAARSFRIQCNKLAVLVRLLLGEIPERTILTQSGMQGALRPYFELTNMSDFSLSGLVDMADCLAVRIGDLELFSDVSEKFAGTFISDRTNNVIVRLRHGVIRIGLRTISICYSRIPLDDVADTLTMHSTNLVESIVAKAIRDGAIDAKIDHANGWLILKETGDIYFTAEPQAAFSSRIAFCVNLHNEAAWNLRFPLDKYSSDEWKSASQIPNRKMYATLIGYGKQTIASANMINIF
ncbi:hypothetical protein POTOM_022125 [Populus tomentosa]|uniref:PCI domain-containing protein n=1 Tax=Populus tomentosa TaxID=118781 RepID=A0A8X8CT40_POPTO|nr:hypothetical protein POTOM_022125 [Populus tomentosa]